MRIVSAYGGKRMTTETNKMRWDLESIFQDVQQMG
jgi:hypothetical protein